MLLLVEDDYLIRFELESALQKAQFSLLTADNGAHAIAALEKHGASIRAVVTDIGLGAGPNGWEVARRARDISPVMPVVYITGDSSHSVLWLGVPGSVLIPKPFSTARLIMVVSTLLTEADGRRPMEGGDG